MFDIAWSEMIVIGAVALIAIGPKDLPKALRAVGAMTAKARRMASEFQDHFREAMREAELESVKEEVANINRDLTAATSGLESEFNTIGSRMPAPSSAPVQLSGAATERDIPGLPQIESKGSEAAEPTATVETPKSAQPLKFEPCGRRTDPGGGVERRSRAALRDRHRNARRLAGERDLRGEEAGTPETRGQTQEREQRCSDRSACAGGRCGKLRRGRYRPARR